MTEKERQHREDVELVLAALRARSRQCDEELTLISDVDEYEEAARIATRYRQMIAKCEYTLEVKTC